MKLGDYFKSMEDVRKYCEQFKGYCTEEQYKALQKVLGVAEQEGIYEEVEGIGKIDKSICEFIKGFNRVGLLTLASCSGLDKDHPNSEEQKTGYVSFKYNDRAKPILEQVAKSLGLKYEETECYLELAICIRFIKLSDEEKEQDFKNFYDEVIKRFNEDTENQEVVG